MSGIVLLILRILLAVSLYTFLAWALITLWQDMKRQSDTLKNRVPAISLSNLDQNLAYHFTKPEVSIGRDPANDCPLPDKTVSTQHARLVFHSNQWWLEDLHSTNGTYLNQDPVSSPLVITNGDQLRFGQVILAISIGE